MAQDSEFNKLKVLLEGKTIVEIKEPNRPESLCIFVLSDKTSFILYATDLGFWTEKILSNNDFYPDLTSLMSACLGETLDTQEQPMIIINNNIIVFSLENGKKFQISNSSLDKTEQNIIKDQSALKILKESVCMGNAWKLWFKKPYANGLSDDCIFT